MFTLRQISLFTTKSKCKEHKNYFTKNRCLFLASADPSPLTLPNYNDVATKLLLKNSDTAFSTNAVFYNLFYLLKITLNNNATKFNLPKRFKVNHYINQKRLRK